MAGWIRATPGVVAIAFAGLGFTAADALAERWAQIVPGNPHALFDADSLRRDANGMIYVRVTVGGPPFVEVVNCRDASSVSKYDQERGQPFERPRPGTVAAGLIARVCR